MSLNVTALMGRLVADPVLRTTTSGNDVVTFKIAVDRPFVKDKNAQTADFITIVAWDHTALFVSRYFSKGSPIGIQGRIQTRQFDDRTGNRRTAFEVVADIVSFCGNKYEGSFSSAQATPNIPPANNTGSYTPSYTENTSGFSTASPSDFEEIADDYDTPF